MLKKHQRQLKKEDVLQPEVKERKVKTIQHLPVIHVHQNRLDQEEILTINMICLLVQFRTKPMTY